MNICWLSRCRSLVVVAKSLSSIFYSHFFFIFFFFFSFFSLFRTSISSVDRSTLSFLLISDSYENRRWWRDSSEWFFVREIDDFDDFDEVDWWKDVDVVIASKYHQPFFFLDQYYVSLYLFSILILHFHTREMNQD